MKYERVSRAVFVSRQNRFVARVETETGPETVHVKNTGRCRELLLPGAEVFLTEPVGKGRKTKYDLVAVRNSAGLVVNIDSQAPNRVVREWLEEQKADEIVPEYRYGESRLDFFVRRGEKRTEQVLIEVKGCTLEIGGVGFFPDAPTERGTRHLRELMRAVQEGFTACLIFVMQVPGMREVRGNSRTDPAFAETLSEAQHAGVRVICLPCRVETDTLEVTDEGRYIRL